MLQSWVKHGWVYNGCRSLHQAPTVSFRCLPALPYSLESTIQTSPHANTVHIHDCRCPSLCTGNPCEKHPHNQYSQTTSSRAPEQQLSCTQCCAESWVCVIQLTPLRNLGFMVLIFQMRKGSFKRAKWVALGNRANKRQCTNSVLPVDTNKPVQIFSKKLLSIVEEKKTWQNQDMPSKL